MDCLVEWHASEEDRLSLSCSTCTHRYSAGPNLLRLAQAVWEGVRARPEEDQRLSACKPRSTRRFQ